MWPHRWRPTEGTGGSCPALQAVCVRCIQLAHDCKVCASGYRRSRVLRPRRIHYAPKQALVWPYGLATGDLSTARFDAASNSTRGHTL